jgi:hypothetical protein
MRRRSTRTEQPPRRRTSCDDDGETDRNDREKSVGRLGVHEALAPGTRPYLHIVTKLKTEPIVFFARLVRRARAFSSSWPGARSPLK